MAATTEAAQPFVVGGPTSAAWREDGLMRAQELEGLAEWIMAAPTDGQASVRLKQSIDSHVKAARDAAAGNDSRGRLSRIASAVRGSGVERTLANLDAVETNLLRLASLEYVRGQMPSLLAHVQRFLAKDDPRRLRVSRIADALEHPDATLLEYERDAVVCAYHAASSQRRRDLIRLRSFRNVIFGTSFLMTLVAVGLGVLGAARPDALPLCFTPASGTVCPTGSSPSSTDIWLLEVVGLVAAAVAGAFALRNIRGTSTPYSLPVALALLKLPTGALTAVLGILLMRGGFVPGLSDLDTSGQIISWALVFGYAQQLFTGLVDRQANAVLQDVGGHGAAGDRRTSSGS